MGYNEDTMTITPEGGIGISEVAKCLGETSDFLGDLCSSPKVNMWARYKPFRGGALGYVTFESFAQASRTARWSIRLAKNPSSTDSSADGAYGSIQSMVSDAKRGYLPEWVYDRPNGGMASPKRLVDFMNYFHLARKPLGASNGSGKILSDDGRSFYYTFGFEVLPENSDPLNLKIGDLYAAGNQELNFRDMYFGAVIYRGDVYYCVTQGQTFGNSVSGWDDIIGMTLTGITNTDFGTAASEWQILPFFSTQPTTSLRNSEGGTAFSGASKFPVSFASYAQAISRYSESEDTTLYIAGLTVGMFTENEEYMDYLYYSYSVRNNSNSAVTLVTRIVVNQNDSSSLNQNVQITEHTITIPARSYYSSAVASQYPNGSQLVEVPMPKAAYSEALREAIGRGMVTATISFANRQETLSTVATDYGSGDPNNP